MGRNEGPDRSSVLLGPEVLFVNLYIRYVELASVDDEPHLSVSWVAVITGYAGMPFLTR
jgi:hypothetical protein